MKFCWYFNRFNLAWCSQWVWHFDRLTSGVSLSWSDSGLSARKFTSRSSYGSFVLGEISIFLCRAGLGVLASPVIIIRKIRVWIRVRITRPRRSYIATRHSPLDGTFGWQDRWSALEPWVLRYLYFLSNGLIGLSSKCWNLLSTYEQRKHPVVVDILRFCLQMQLIGGSFFELLHYWRWCAQIVRHTKCWQHCMCLFSNNYELGLIQHNFCSLMLNL